MPYFPRNKRLLSDENSNVFLYMSGHGGNGFLKFQDVEEIISTHLAKVINFMWKRKRYSKLLMVIDTCQAASMFKGLEAPNFIGISSSRVGESSWSHRYDERVGVSLADRFTSVMVETLLASENGVYKKISDFVSSLMYSEVLSHPEFHTNKLSGSVKDALFSDFLVGNNVYLTPSLIGSPPDSYAEYHPELDTPLETLHPLNPPTHESSYTSKSYILISNNPPCPSYTYNVVFLIFFMYLIILILSR